MFLTNYLHERGQPEFFAAAHHKQKNSLYNFLSFISLSSRKPLKIKSIVVSLDSKNKKMKNVIFTTLNQIKLQSKSKAMYIFDTPS